MRSGAGTRADGRATLSRPRPGTYRVPETTTPFLRKIGREGASGPTMEPASATLPYRLDPPPVEGVGGAPRHDGAFTMRWIPKAAAELRSRDLPGVLVRADALGEVADVRRLVAVLVEWRQPTTYGVEAVLERILTRAVAKADAEGLLWTPLMDVIATLHRMSQQLDLPARIARLMSWMQQQSATAPLWPLAYSDCHALRTAAVRRIFEIDPSAAPRLLAPDAGCWIDLYRATDSPPERHRALEHWAIDTIGAEQRPPRSWESARPRPAFAAMHMLHAMESDGVLEESALAALREMAVPGGGSARRGRPHLRPPRRVSARARWAQLVLLELSDQLPASVVEALYDMNYARRASDGWLADGLRQAKVPLRFLRKMARTLRPDAAYTWEMLVMRGVGLDDPPFFRALAARAPLHLVALLLKEPMRHQWPHLVRRFAAVDVHHGVLEEALCQADQSDLQEIRRQDWASLTRSKKAEPGVSILGPERREKILSLIPSARACQRVRRHLLASADPRVLFGLCLDATGEEAVALFARLEALDPSWANRAILESSTLAAILPRARIAPVLGTADDRRRTHLIHVLLHAKAPVAGA